MTLIITLLLMAACPQEISASRVSVIASTSADTVLTQDPQCRDEELLRLERGDPWARLWMPAGGWNALLGDSDFDAQFDAPAGIDGLEWVPRGSGMPSLFDLWFTTDSDFLTWQDGDVLRVDPSGTIERVIAEDSIRTALGTPSAFDLDAIARDPDGRLYFSIRDGLATTVLGAVEDGDVLIYDPTSASVTRAWTESEVQSWVDHAAPGSGAIGDVKGLAFDPESGALLFLVQSPSAQDATVFTSAGGGGIFRGFEEADFGFMQSTELDALAVLGGELPQHPIIVADQVNVAPGQSFTLRVRHAVPYAVLQGIASSRRAPKPSTRGGFAIAVPDLNAAVRVWPMPNGQINADVSGSASIHLTVPPLPPGAVFLDLYLQLWDGAGGGLSTPWVLRVQ
ncbi:MAG: hypothetical protein O3A20_11260 [Planctomycetota bacterium]|nr:hypothetical protein [Planctomycetota bacterium]